MFKDRWGAPSWQNISCPRTITQHVPWLAAVKYKYALAHCIPQHLEKSRFPPHVSSSTPFLAEHITWHIPHFPTSFALTLLPRSTSFPMVCSTQISDRQFGHLGITILQKLPIYISKPQQKASRTLAFNIANLTLPLTQSAKQSYYHHPSHLIQKLSRFSIFLKVAVLFLRVKMKKKK